MGAIRALAGTLLGTFLAAATMVLTGVINQEGNGLDAGQMGLLFLWIWFFTLLVAGTGAFGLGLVLGEILERLKKTVNSRGVFVLCAIAVGIPFGLVNLVATTVLLGGPPLMTPLGLLAGVAGGLGLGLGAAMVGAPAVTNRRFATAG